MCQKRWAEAWEFAAYWCSSKMLVGTHQGGTNSQLLCDPNQNFLEAQVQVGMVLDNLTTGASGTVTDVDGDGQQLTSKLGGGTRQTWARGDQYRLVPITVAEKIQIEHFLDISGGLISVTVEAAGACDCLTPAALGLLKSLQIRNVSSWMSCGCMGVSFTDTRRQQLRLEVERELELIRTKRLDLCGGGGIDVPAFETAEQSHTVWNAERILTNGMLRDGY